MTSPLTNIPRVFAHPAAGPDHVPMPAPRRRIVRVVAVAAIAAQALFVAAWVVAGALQDHYDGIDQYVSELGGLHAHHAAVMNVAFGILGASLVALAVALAWSLPRRRAARVTVALFVLAGLCFVLVGLLRVDCNLSVDERCVAASDAGSLSWHHYAHLWVGFVEQIALVLTPFALARALWPSPPGALALLAGVWGVGIGVLGTALNETDGVPDGLVQRVEFAAVHVWVVLVAIGLLHAARRDSPPDEATAMRPRDFFGTAWSGQGEVVAWPRPIWRRLAQRAGARRTSTPVSDHLWVVEDTAAFPDGRVETRRMFCELVAPDRVHVTADDLPDGAEVSLADDGYRVWPYRFAVPIGPVRVLLRCRHRSRIEPGGSLVDTIDIRWLGLPVARATFRMRPEPSS